MEQSLHTQTHFNIIKREKSGNPHEQSSTKPKQGNTADIWSKSSSLPPPHLDMYSGKACFFWDIRRNRSENNMQFGGFLNCLNHYTARNTMLPSPFPASQQNAWVQPRQMMLTTTNEQCMSTYTSFQKWKHFWTEHLFRLPLRFCFKTEDIYHLPRALFTHPKESEMYPILEGNSQKCLASSHPHRKATLLHILHIWYPILIILCSSFGAFLPLTRSPHSSCGFV